MTEPRVAPGAAQASTTPVFEGTDRTPPAAEPAGGATPPAGDATPPAGDATPPAGDATPPGVDAAGLAAWFAEHVPEVTPPLLYRLIPGGHSNLTFLVTDAAGRRFVLRRPPVGHLLPTAHDMGREQRIVAAVGRGGVPAPSVVGYCADPTVTGAPFYVMDFVEGSVLRTEAEAEAAFDPAGRTALAWDLVDTLASVHALDPDAVGLGDLGRREGYIARQLRRWYAQYLTARDEQDGPDVADIDRAHSLLAAHIPEQQRTGIVHGDYRLDNTIVGADAKVAAVLDWELCTLGDTMADLGQLLVYWADPGEVPVLDTATTAPGFPIKTELAGRYERVTGRSLDRLDFYVAFAYWKLGCILEGVYTRYVAGAMGDDGVDFHPFPDRIADVGARAVAIAERVR